MFFLFFKLSKNFKFFSTELVQTQLDNKLLILNKEQMDINSWILKSHGNAYIHFFVIKCFVKYSLKIKHKNMYLFFIKMKSFL